MRSYQFRIQFKIYTGSYQEFRFNNWSCFIKIRIIINIYIIRSMIQFILTNQIFIIFLMHMENYPLTWLESNKTQSWYWRKSYWRPAGRISGLSEYKWDMFKNDSKKHITYLIHLSKGVFPNPICFWTN
jgi:hypothetical protein